MVDYWEEKEPIEKKLNIKKLIIVIVLAIFIIFLIIADYIYINNKEFRTWTDRVIFRKEIYEENTTQISINEEENVKAYIVNNHVAILRKKKIELFDKFGSKENEFEVDINNPIFYNKNKFLVIAEEEGKNIYLIDEKKILWKNEIEGEISQVVVNKDGYVAVVVTNTSYKSVIYMYDVHGKELFKTYLATARVVDLTISENAKYLAIAEIDTTGILTQSIIKNISIEKAQKEPEKSFVNTYNAEVGKLIANIEYQGNDKVVCVYDNSIEVLEGQNSKIIYDFENDSISFYSNELLNNVLKINEKASSEYTADSIVKIKNVLNDKEKEYTTNQVVKDVYTCENIIALNLGTELHIINTNGWLIKKYISEKEINNVIISENIVGIIQRDKINIINL